MKINKIKKSKFKTTKDFEKYMAEREHPLDENLKLKESKQDTENFKQWLTKKAEELGMRANSLNIDSYVKTWLDTFEKERKNVKAPLNDYYYWIKKDDFDEFTKTFQELNQKRDSENKAKEGAKLLYSDNDWKVYHITNYEASKKYGANTKWCITGSKRWANGEKGEKFWKDYHEKNNIEFYFFISKEDKWALCVYPDNKHIEIWASNDVKVPFIPNAPLVDELKNINYRENENSDYDRLCTMIVNNQLPFDVFSDVVYDVISSETGEMEDMSVFNNPAPFCEELEQVIPDGYLETQLVIDGELSEQEYKEITGDDFSEDWGGDIPQINSYDLSILPRDTKENVCDPNNEFYSEVEYFTFDRSEYGDCYINLLDNWGDLLIYLSEIANINNWEEDAIEDFYSTFSSAASVQNDIFTMLCANSLLWDIANNHKSKQILKDLGFSDESINNLINKFTSRWQTESLNEAFNWNTKSNLTPRLKKLVDECLDEMKDIGYDINNRSKDSYLNEFPLVFKVEDRNTSALGTAYYPENGNTYITLNSRIEALTDEQIKNTIIHELCHILAYEKDFKSGNVWYDKEDNKCRGYSKKLSHHGPVWKNICQDVARKLNISLQRLADAESSVAFKDERAKDAKYVFECPNGHKVVQMRASDFVRTYDKKMSDGSPMWYCGKCKKELGQELQYKRIK